MRKSKKKSQNARNGILEAHTLKVFLGQHAPDPREVPAHGDHGHGYAGPKTVFFLVDRAGISEF